MELTTSWMEEGIEIGREREYQLLLRQLRKRFGPLESEWEARIRGFSFEQLEALKTRLDLETWLSAH
jgi:hypothetical protein